MIIMVIMIYLKKKNRNQFGSQEPPGLNIKIRSRPGFIQKVEWLFKEKLF